MNDDIIYAGISHKDIIYKGISHKAVYLGNKLVWEKNSENGNFLGYFLNASTDEKVFGYNISFTANILDKDTGEFKRKFQKNISKNDTDFFAGLYWFKIPYALGEYTATRSFNEPFEITTTLDPNNNFYKDIWCLIVGGFTTYNIPLNSNERFDSYSYALEISFFDFISHQTLSSKTVGLAYTSITPTAGAPHALIPFGAGETSSIRSISIPLTMTSSKDDWINIAPIIYEYGLPLKLKVEEQIQKQYILIRDRSFKEGEGCLMDILSPSWNDGVSDGALYGIKDPNILSFLSSHTSELKRYNKMSHYYMNSKVYVKIQRISEKRISIGCTAMGEKYKDIVSSISSNRLIYTITSIHFLGTDNMTSEHFIYDVFWETGGNGISNMKYDLATTLNCAATENDPIILYIPNNGQVVVSENDGIMQIITS